MVAQISDHPRRVALNSKSKWQPNRVKTSVVNKIKTKFSQIKLRCIQLIIEVNSLTLHVIVTIDNRQWEGHRHHSSVNPFARHINKSIIYLSNFKKKDQKMAQLKSGNFISVRDLNMKSIVCILLLLCNTNSSVISYGLKVAPAITLCITKQFLSCKSQLIIILDAYLQNH